MTFIEVIFSSIQLSEGQSHQLVVWWFTASCLFVQDEMEILKTTWALVYIKQATAKHPGAISAQSLSCCQLAK